LTKITLTEHYILVKTDDIDFTLLKQAVSLLENTMKIYDTFEVVADVKPCIKRPVTVYALQIQEEFRVNSLEGNYAQGKPGDYLMQGVDGELYICDKAIFEKSYNFI